MLRSSICKKCTNNTFTIKAKCSASSKNIKIDVVTLTRITSRVEKAKYSCPAGASSYCNHMCVCVCVCVCVCACVGGWVGVGGCVRPSTEKASSVWISWTTSEQINNVVLETFISYGKSLHRYCRMKHLTFLTSHFILN